MIGRISALAAGAAAAVVAAGAAAGAALRRRRRRHEGDAPGSPVKGRARGRRPGTKGRAARSAGSAVHSATGQGSAAPAGPGPASAAREGSTAPASSRAGADASTETGATGRSPGLREIKGLGAVSEQRLAEAGVDSVAQVAAWSEADVDEVAARISVSAERIRREDWVGQARALLGKA